MSVGELQVYDITPVWYLPITESRLVKSTNRNMVQLQQFLATTICQIWSKFFVFLYCVLLCVVCMIAEVCNTVRWTWWDWSLSLGTLLPSVLWHCWLGHLTHKNRPRNDNVFSGTLNPTHFTSLHFFVFQQDSALAHGALNPFAPEFP